jgi:hypothetical protein
MVETDGIGLLARAEHHLPELMDNQWQFAG